MAQYYPGEETLAQSEVWYYDYTPHSFIRREIPLDKRGRDRHGNPVTLSWLAERFANGAAALNLISTHTTIPVPRLKGWGRDHNGLCFFETERVLGSVRCDQTGDQCRMPQFPLTDGPCKDCWEIAYSYADNFVWETVFPQLWCLKSSTTGLNGVVLPPRWRLEHDKRTEWPSKLSSTCDYVFGHIDLTANNIMLDSQTLEVKTLFDWEDSGYFPPAVQQWKYTRFDQFGLYEDMDTVRRHIALIAT